MPQTLKQKLSSAALPSLHACRCLELLGAYPTSWEEDAAWLEGAGAAASDNMRNAVRFRMGKKEVLLAAAEALAG